MSERRLMPFEGFRAMSDRAMRLEILLDCSAGLLALSSSVGFSSARMDDEPIRMMRDENAG
jgi:hypothetical protein